MKTSIITLALAAIAFAPITRAEEAKTEAPDKPAADAPKLQINPTGRILMDGAVYLGGNDNINTDEGSDDKKFVDGVSIPDLRLGVKASYGKWQAKIDVGFGYGKVSLKDIFLQYNINSYNTVKAGYYCPQFGLNSETSSSMKPSFEEPTSNEFFYANPRLLAASYIFSKAQYFAAVTAFTEASAMTNNANALGKESWGAETRLVWRPKHFDGNTIQVGMSLCYSSPTSDNHTGFSYTANFPTRVSKVPLLVADVSNARGSFKLTPEFLFMRGRFALETQYYYMNIARKEDFSNYRAHGAYALFRTLLIGSQYTYNTADCGMATPPPRSLELVLGYNYTNATDKRAGIYGGVTNDASMTLNYYINKYMIARLRYSYTNLRDATAPDGPIRPDRHVNLIEARLQFIL